GENFSRGKNGGLRWAPAWVPAPPVLLLDEPTSGLDRAGGSAMLRLLLQLGKEFGKSLLLSTHLLGDVEQVCEQVVILFNGEVRGQGTVAELCARRQDRYKLQIPGDAQAFLAEL